MKSEQRRRLNGNEVLKNDNTRRETRRVLSLTSRIYHKDSWGSVDRVLPHEYLGRPRRGCTDELGVGRPTDF